MLSKPDLGRRRLILAGLAFGMVTPAVARELAFGGGPRDRAEIESLLATGSLSLQTSLIAMEGTRDRRIRSFTRSEIAEQRHIGLAVTGSRRPAPLGRKEAGILAEARSLRPGPAADRVYVLRQLSGHRKLRALAEGYVSTGDDRRVVKIAHDGLPLIYRHLTILGGLHQSLA